MFWEHMPRGYVRALLQLLVSAYTEAIVHCKEVLAFQDTEADNVAWAIRRGKIEGGMRRLALEHPGMTAEVMLGRNSMVPNPWNHSLIKCGRVWITQCSLQHKDEAKHSFSREFYSLRNQQKYLFSDMEPPAAPNDSPLYAIIGHGRDLASPGKLGFAYVKFPMPGMAQYYLEEIDLLSEFVDIGSLLRNPLTSLPPSENIGEPPTPELREDGQVE